MIVQNLLLRCFLVKTCLNPTRIFRQVILSIYNYNIRSIISNSKLFCFKPRKMQSSIVNFDVAPFKKALDEKLTTANGWELKINGVVKKDLPGNIFGLSVSLTNLL